MKAKDFISLAKQLEPVLPGFTIKGPMMFISPIAHVLRGLYFEGSNFDAKSFYIWAFFLPMCVPTEHVSFNLGIRIRGDQGERWNIDAPNMIPKLVIALEREALPFLSSVQSPRDAADAALSLQKSGDPYVQQAIAYAFARDGDRQQAITALAQLARLLDVKEQYPWQQEMRRRAEALTEELRDNPSAAQRRLESWEAETTKRLGLQGFVK